MANPYCTAGNFSYPKLNYQHLAAFLLLAIVMVAAFHEVIFGHSVLFPHNLTRWYPWRYYSDMIAKDGFGYYGLSDTPSFYYPKLKLVKDAIGLGQIPVWNPFIFCGSPNALVIPLDIFFFPFMAFTTLIKSMSFSALTHIYMSGIFMYLFLRALKLGFTSSLMGGLLYMFNSYSLILVSLSANLNTVCWLPVMFYLLEKVLERDSFMFVGPAAIVFAFNFYESYPQLTVHTMYLMAFYLLLRLYIINKGIKYNLRIAGMLALSVVLGAIIFSPQAYLMFDAAQYTDRLSKAFEYFAKTVYPFPDALAMLFSFDIFGRPMSPEFWGKGYPTVPSGYLGSLVVLLAVCSLSHEDKHYVYFWWAVMVIALSFSFSNTFYKLLVDYLPLFDISRPRGITHIIFCGIILASYGFDRLMSGRRLTGLGYAVSIVALLWVIMLWATVFPAFVKENIARLLKTPIVLSHFDTVSKGLLYSFSLMLSALAGAYLYVHGLIKGAFFAVTVLIIAVIDIFTVNLSYCSTQDDNTLYYRTKSIEYMQKDTSLFRIVHYSETATLPGNIAGIYGIQDTSGYDNLVLDSYKDIYRRIDKSSIDSTGRSIRTISNPDALGLPVFDLMNIKYLITAKTLNHDKWDLVFDKDMFIYRNRDFIGRAFVVGDWEVEPDRKKVLEAIIDKGFVPLSKAYLEVEPGLRSGAGITATIDFLDYTPNRVSIEVDAEGSGLLVLADTYFHTWKAYVDGVPREVLRADYNFRAVRIEDGRHRVDFVYEDARLYKLMIAGAVILLLSVLTTLIYIYRKAAYKMA